MRQGLLSGVEEEEKTRSQWLILCEQDHQGGLAEAKERVTVDRGLQIREKRSWRKGSVKPYRGVEEELVDKNKKVKSLVDQLLDLHFQVISKYVFILLFYVVLSFFLLFDCSQRELKNVLLWLS